MFKLTNILLTVLFILSCNSKQQHLQRNNSDSSNTVQLYIPPYPVNKFEGSYTGAFSNGFITINLNYVQGRTVSGYTIQRGIRRNLNGTLKPNGKSFSFVIHEAGNKRSDGIFQFTIDTVRFVLNGSWKPIDTSNIESIPLLLKREGKKNDIMYENELGAWIPAKGNFRRDTTLDFFPEGGVCEYKFYEFAGDSTSRIISMKGSYLLNKDSVLIDWQKNAWTPALKMKLVRTIITKPGKENGELHLVGHGWNLIKLEGD
jgi:hypothetical protein